MIEHLYNRFRLPIGNTAASGEKFIFDNPRKTYNVTGNSIMKFLFSQFL